MDEKDKKIAELTQALAVEKAGRELDKKTFEKSIAEKDILIKQKTEDIIGIRRENTRLKDLTAEERTKMSEIEIKHHEALLLQQQENDKLKKEIDERNTKEVVARKERVFAKFAGKDLELKKKLEEAFGKIVDHDKAQTDEEIASIAQSAYNMLGIPKADPVRQVITANGGDVGGAGESGNFADSETGKSLSSAMGLPVEAPKA